MEMFALIKDINGTRVVKASDVQAKVNSIAKVTLMDFFNNLIIKNGENYRVTLDDVSLFECYDVPFSNFISDRILKNNILKKRRMELKKILRNVFNEFNIDTRLISSFNSNYNLFSYFYSDEKGRVSFDYNGIKNSFDRIFGQLISEQLVEELKRQLSVNDYSLEYSVLDFKNIILSSDDIIDINPKNFEHLLYELGEITDPGIPASIRHRCYNCENLSPLLCEKAEIDKKKISDYPFIKYGYQIYMISDNDDLMLNSFIVEACDDYKRSSSDSIDEEEYSYVKRLRK